MRHSTKPSFTQADVFDDCIERMRKSKRRDRIAANRSKVIKAGSDYAIAAASAALHEIDPNAYLPLSGSATPDDMEWFYENRFVKSAAGKPYYDQLKLGNRDGRCALCNLSPAGTLDHHLPQAEHPILTVTPDNLLPACMPCNKIKLASLSPTLNTYYDDLGTGPWLRAIVVPAGSAVIDFEVSPQSNWTADLAARAKTHFDLFGLRRLYSYEATRHLAGIRSRLASLLAQKDGAKLVADHLSAEASSWWVGEPNSWEAAFYSAAAASTWFCAGGFK